MPSLTQLQSWPPSCSFHFCGSIVKHNNFMWEATASDIRGLTEKWCQKLRIWLILCYHIDCWGSWSCRGDFLRYIWQQCMWDWVGVVRALPVKYQWWWVLYTCWQLIPTDELHTLAVATDRGYDCTHHHDHCRALKLSSNIHAVIHLSGVIVSVFVFPLVCFN